MNFTYTGTSAGAIYAAMDSVTGLTSTEFATKAELVGSSASSASKSSDAVAVGTDADAADLTINYTLTNS